MTKNAIGTVTTICSLNEKNAKRFIAKYGPVNDIELAKLLLCITSNAWYILDDSLKKNSEVIMYYQPMGKHLCEVQVDYGCRETIASAWGNQKGFGIEHIDYYGDFPEIDYPEDFDYKLYSEIQEKLKEKVEAYRMCPSSDSIIPYLFYFTSNKRISSSKRILIENIEFDNEEIEQLLDDDYSNYSCGPEEPITFEEYYYLYDRSCLKNIVEELSNKVENKPKQKRKK